MNEEDFTVKLFDIAEPFTIENDVSSRLIKGEEVFEKGIWL